MERSSKNEYFKYLNETSNFIKDELKSTYLSFMRELNQPILDAFRSNNDIIVRNRLEQHQNLLRPNLVRIGLNFSKIYNWRDYKDIMLAIELFNISTYQSNSSFDSKRIDVGSSTAYNNQFILSQISLFLCNSLITNCNIISDKEKIFMLNQINYANRSVYLGQLMEQNIFNNPNVFNLDENEYLKLYIQRCSLLDGVQIGVSLSLGTFNLDEYHRNIFYQIGFKFGIMLQMIDDLADFNPIEKKYEDLKNRLITYPLYLLNNSSPNRFEDTLKIFNNEINDDFLESLSKRLKEWVILEKILEQIRIQFIELKVLIKKLKENNYSIELLDFIFPHIFLSRKIRFFIKQRNLYNRFLNNYGKSK